MEKFNVTEFDKIHKDYEDTRKTIDEAQVKIQKSVADMAKMLGIEKIKLVNFQEYDKFETYNVLKIKSMKDFDGKELLDLEMDYGYIDHDFTHAFEEVEMLEPTNTIRFIKDGEGSKYDHLDSGEIDNINFGSLALHCLRNGIEREVMGSFLYAVFYGRDYTPSDWWDDY